MKAWSLETERLQLRRVTVDDADLMLAIWNDPAFLCHVGDRGVRTTKQARDAVMSSALRLYAKYGYGPYVVLQKSDKARIGICGLFRREHLDEPDIGFALLPDYCGKGLASEAAFAVLAHGRDDLGLKTITAIVSPDNESSIALIRKLGLSFAEMITMPGEEQEICLYRKVLGT